MKNDGSDVKRISFGNGLYGTPVWSPRGDLIAFTKLHKKRLHFDNNEDQDGSEASVLVVSFLSL